MATEAGGGALTLGTAGHIDHGKTTLVGALTGTETDRLAEEKRRGISIELGFAELALPSGRRLGVVDAPGHERLVRTMVAGAAGIDVFLLVVAADDGVMPQTREHRAVLAALGVDHGVIALTRCDLADAEMRRLAAEEARGLVPGAPLVEVSAPAGAGLEELREALDEVASAAAATRAGADAGGVGDPGVLHVDRSFTLHGIGTVVTGTVARGRFAAGERVEALPAGRASRARGIQVHGRDVEAVGRGSRAALDLAGLATDEVARGDVVTTAAGWPAASYRLDVELLARGDRPLRLDRRMQVHHGTRDCAARVVELGGGLAQLRLEAPVFAAAGDRIVLRRIAPPDTVAGGLVLDPFPVRHGPGPRVAHLEALRAGSPEEILASALGLAGERGIDADPGRWRAVPELAYGLRRFGPQRWSQAIAALEEEARLLRSGDRLLEPDAAPAPEPQAPAPRPPAELERRLLELLWADGLEPRAPGPLADSLGVGRDEVAAALGELVAAGELVRVKADVHYPRERLERIEALVLALAERRGSVGLAELRDDLRTSRKYSQAVLEHLDASGLTVRQGDRHLPRRSARRGPVGAAE